MHQYTITGPESTWPTPQALLAEHRGRLKKRELEPRAYVGRPPVVFVDQGAALIDCTCGNAPQASRPWGLAVCFSCGLVYTQLLFPMAWSDIDMLLSVRPIRNQNLKPGEALAQLSEENRAHHLPHMPDAIRAARKAARLPEVLAQDAGAVRIRSGGRRWRG